MSGPEKLTPMKTGDKISLLLAAVAAILVLAVMVALQLMDAEVASWMLIAFPAAAFIISFIPARFLIDNLFSKKLPPEHDPLNDPFAEKKSGMKSGAADFDNEAEAEGETMSPGEKKKTELEKLKSLETYRKEFLGNVYHELKTPIFNIQGYILTLIEGGLDDADINKLYLERTEQNINRMISVVDDLESISGLESGALNPRLEEFNIKKVIKEVFEANEIRAKKLNIKLETGKLKTKDEMVKADKKLIFQVLNNLVMNSINYGVKNGKTRVNLKSSNDKLYIEVKDNGIGISPEHVHRIFERFYRVDKSRSRDTGGTGLGLSIVKHIIEAHKQSIRVNSVPGKGSSFIFSLDKA